MTFNNDGTKMYVIGSSGRDVNEYISMALIFLQPPMRRKFSVIDEEYVPQEVVFNHDGTKMFIVGAASGAEVNQYNLSTGFDISTATYAQNILIDDGLQLDSHLIMMVQNYLLLGQLEIWFTNTV